MKLDWNLYREYFPRRYWDASFFDQFILSFIKNDISVLDLGCGIYGTKSLQNKNIKLYSCDPNIDKPSWSVGHVTLDSKLKFDLIIARGSINYLNENELKSLKKMLAPNGILIFNTFYNLKIKKRKRTFLENGHFIREDVKVLKNIIKHKLYSRGKVLKHSFFNYSTSDFSKIFNGISFLKYNKSIIGIYKMESSYG